MTAAEVGELPALRRRHEQLTRVRIRKGRAGAPRDVGMLELLDRTVRPVPPSNDIVPLEAKRDVHSREAVQPPSQLRGVRPRTGEKVDLAGAVRSCHDDLALEIRE